MTSVSASEFSARAQELLKSVEAGETVVVHRDGTPIARLEPSVATETESEDESEKDTSSGVHVYSLRPKPMSEFRFGTAVMSLSARPIEVNLAWFPDGSDDDD
jgi:prevent-host-death family protein